MSSLLISLLDTLFPKNCLGCKEQGTSCCRDCFETIPLLKNPSLTTEETPLLSGLFAATIHEEKSLAARLIHFLKYESIEETAIPLARLLEYAARNVTQKSKNLVLVPVPLHARRLRQRGFNQSEMLARLVGRTLDLPMFRGLQRTRFTPPQMELSREKRLQNVLGAFSLSQANRSLRLSPDITYALVDDVSTTGATLSECAKVLRENGAKQVLGLVVARAL